MNHKRDRISRLRRLRKKSGHPGIDCATQLFVKRMRREGERENVIARAKMRAKRALELRRINERR